MIQILATKSQRHKENINMIYEQRLTNSDLRNRRNYQSS